jgi:hypothetical protein
MAWLPRRPSAPSARHSGAAGTKGLVGLGFVKPCKDQKAFKGTTMQPLKLTIPGRYWDSQLYAGRLYLFDRDGTLRTINWDRLVSEWQLDSSLRLAMQCAFCRSDYLYGNQWSLAFSDHEILAVIRSKFDRLSVMQLEVAATRLDEVSIGAQISPFPFPHADSTIYRKNIFVATSEGVFRATCNKRTRKPVSSRSEKTWDAAAQAIAASYGSLAIAAGDDGLFEFPISNGWPPTDSQARSAQVAPQNCTDCSWAFYSIFASSHLNSGYLASFKKEMEYQQHSTFRRVFKGVISAEDIFHDRGYSWGSQDKFCQAHEQVVSITRYTPWAEEDETQLENLGSVDLGPETIQLASWKGGVVAGGLAAFGVIIECENALVIAPSEGSPITVPEEPVNWRIFPRSVQYENQLHVICNDRLEIYSFNQDYFVDQTRKVLGTRYFGVPKFPSGRSRRIAPTDELR